GITESLTHDTVVNGYEVWTLASEQLSGSDIPETVLVDQKSPGKIRSRTVYQQFVGAFSAGNHLAGNGGQQRRELCSKLRLEDVERNLRWYGHAQRFNGQEVSRCEGVSRGRRVTSTTKLLKQPACEQVVRLASEIASHVAHDATLISECIKNDVFHGDKE